VDKPQATLQNWPRPCSLGGMATRIKSALIIGASGGIGTAAAELCVARGFLVQTLSRRDDGLDITEETSIQASAASIKGGLDLIIIATGVLETAGFRPERTITTVTKGSLETLFMANAVGPALLLKHFTPKLTKTRRAVIIVLSARVGSIADNQVGGWMSFRASKAALNQIVRTTALELERKNPHAICIAYHPGNVETELSKKFLKSRASVAPSDAAQDLMSVYDTLNPRDTGQFFDWAGKRINW